AAAAGRFALLLMATQSSPSFSRFMGFGLKSYSTSPSPRNRSSTNESDWYIPYNGPYEQPRPTYRREKEPNRDSWGDPVFEEGENDEEVVFDDVELRNRYGGRTRARTQSLSQAAQFLLALWIQAGSVWPLHDAPLSLMEPMFLLSLRISILILQEEWESLQFLVRVILATLLRRGGRAWIRWLQRKLSENLQQLVMKSITIRTARNRFPSPTTLRSTHSLQNSISTPDLRHAARATPRAKPPLPKGKDRWLSAETWPRFKVKQNKDLASGRIVSPPGSPVLGYFANGNGPQPGMASRVLAHSRSMIDLNAPPVAGPSRLAPDYSLRVPPLPEKPLPSPTSSNRPPRPKSWALDDLALPSPVPSLARVLEEGQILEHQRKKWQAQAVNSFQNHRARSLSRTRAKSLTNKQPKAKDTSRMEFLAARGLLGNQDVIPVTVVKPRQRSDSQTESRGTTAGTSSRHHHSSSLSKTLSRSSRTHSRNHSRSESIGKSAAKIVKQTASALCAFDDEGISPAEERPRDIEGVLQTNSTKLIKLADPAQLYIESPLSSRNGHSVSPTPSGISESRMGIALTTPPMTEETLESIRMPAHPYAQGGLSFYTPPYDLQSNARGGPYPSGSEQQQAVAKNQTLAPQSWHPYAKAGSSSRDSYQSEIKVVPRLRSDSNVPPPQKMWAQWSSGVVQEILPNEIQYSPYLPSTDDFQVRKQVRNSSPIYDTVGVGETLAWAAMQPYSRDSGIGTSEEHTPARVEQHDPELSRKPVQYDVTRPLYLQKAVPTSPLQVAVSSSTPVPPATPPRNDSSGNQSSNSSPPISPPPPLGSVDDLANFHDLFYRPNISRNVSAKESIAPPEIPWDVNSSGQRGSGLSSIARQLSEELDESHGSLKHSISLRSQSSLSALRQNSATGKLRMRTSWLSNRPFRFRIYFLTTIGIIDEFRLGHIESVTTPPAVSGENRVSFAGQMAFAMGEEAQQDHHDDESEDDEDEDAQLLSAHPTHSSLQPPSSVPTRSSYMTTSDASRMSGLSDFPDPPPQRMTPAHMSLLSSYFDDTITEKEIADVRAYGHVKPATRSRSGSVLNSRPEGQAPAKAPGDVPTPPYDRQEGKSSFDNDGNEEIDDLIASLSPL
ncbi:hypothetical protein BT96DRAFT_922410, partial [Gymnopus androsaceus JB14]